MTKQEKLIADIRLMERSGSWLNPSNPNFAYIRQTEMRWTLELRARKISLPGFDHVYILTTLKYSENQVPSFQIEQISEVRDFYREFDVTIWNLPTPKHELTLLLNNLIPSVVLEGLDANAKTANQVIEAGGYILQEGENCRIVLKSSENKHYKVDLLLCPSGPFPFGGKAFISVLDKNSQLKIIKKLFDYQVDMQLLDLVGSIKLMRNKVLLIPRIRLQKQYPERFLAIELSLPKLLEDSDQFFLTNIDHALDYLDYDKDSAGLCSDSLRAEYRSAGN